MPEPPPIPVRLSHRPTLAGLVVPWITATTPDGRQHFGQVDAQRLAAAFVERLCGIDGEPLGRRVVFAMRDADLRRFISAEPGMHPECAHYSVASCPMLAGRMDRYRATNAIAAEIGIPLGDPKGQRAGHAAEPWSLLWATDYQVMKDPATGLPLIRLGE